MRCMVLIKATSDSEKGSMPDGKLLSEMGKYNEELVRAGVILAGEGLRPSSRGARVKFSGDERIVTRGPFDNQAELLSGFWIWKVDSMETAIDWVKRCPGMAEQQAEIEIRQIAEAEDYGEAFTPEMRENEEKMREQLEKK